MSEGFAVGQRVRLKASTAPYWLDAKIRRRAELGRMGTIQSIIGTANPAHKRSYWVQFDQAPREKPCREQFDYAVLEAAP